VPTLPLAAHKEVLNLLVRKEGGRPVIVEFGRPDSVWAHLAYGGTPGPRSPTVNSNHFWPSPVMCTGLSNLKDSVRPRITDGAV
jgi:hypothetical protein